MRKYYSIQEVAEKTGKSQKDPFAERKARLCCCLPSLQRRTFPLSKDTQLPRPGRLGTIEVHGTPSCRILACAGGPVCGIPYGDAAPFRD